MNGRDSGAKRDMTRPHPCPTNVLECLQQAAELAQRIDRKLGELRENPEIPLEPMLDIADLTADMQTVLRWLERAGAKTTPPRI